MPPFPTLTRRHFLLGAASLALTPCDALALQGTPVPMPAQTPETMVAVRLDRLPAKRINAFFARYTFGAGGEMPSFERVGSAFLVAQSGSITLTADGPVDHRRAGQNATPPAAGMPEGAISLGPGDGALVPDGARMSLRNDSGEAANLLALVIHGPFHEFSYTHPTLLPGASGVEQHVIGLGVGVVEEVPAILVIERDVVRQGGSSYSSTFMGIEIGAVASGSARATFLSGATWTTPGALTSSDVPILPGTMHAEPGSRVELATNDGYVSQDASIAWRATGEQPLVVLRAQVIPVPQPAT